MEIVIYILISIAAGFIIAFIVTGAMKAQLKSVRRNDSAASYIKRDSMRVDVSTQMFLYKELEKTKRETNNNK